MFKNIVPEIKIESTYEHEFLNPDEKIRRIYSFSVGEQMADMMAVIEGDGLSRAYNMDGDMYFNGDKAPEVKIPDEILNVLVDMSIKEIEREFRQYENFCER